jgi:DNA mismatch repair ATPase MutS
VILGSLVTAPLLVSLAITETLPRTPARALAAVLALQGLFVLAVRPRVAPAIHAVDTPARDLDLFASVVALFERESFVSQRLQELTGALRHSSRVASREIRRLDQLVALLASRTNIIAALPAALVFWGTQMAFAIDRWRMRLSPDIPRWLDAIGELDALLALATYAAEHPDHAFPDVADGAPAVDAAALAHPLLPSDAVPNDVALGGSAPHLIVVSGSNMSGKSTMLRALGLNVVLAQAGAPVRASRMSLSPLTVGASIRVLDSLMDGRSRFYAEITRLKHVVDLVSTREGHVLYLFDEILSGTNSHDRQHGADALLSGLLARGAIGLVTTHDLALGRIAERLAPRASNMHFEDRFEEGSMSFDYRLRPGIVRTSNAVPLMRSIGLDV